MMANGNAPATPRSLLVRALLGLSNSLDGLIDQYAPGDPKRGQLIQAQTDLANAANDVDADELMAAIQGNTDLQTLSAATNHINATADALAKSEAQVAKIVAVASAAVALGNAVTGGGVGAIIDGVTTLKDAAS